MDRTGISDSWGGGLKARAGALTLLYLASFEDRDVLRGMLVEAATGVEIQNVDSLAEYPGDAASESQVEIADEGGAGSVFDDSAPLYSPGPAPAPAGEIGPDTPMRTTGAGRELLFAAGVLERWLNNRPEGPLELGEEAGPTLSALLIGWASTAMHAIAGKPLTGEEASEAVPTLEGWVVEHRLAEMEEAGLLDSLPDGSETRYAATDWLRAGVAPFIAAARLEIRHPLGDTAPLAVADIEAAFQLALPLLRLPADVSGSCAMAVELDKEVSELPVGVTVHVEEGRIVSCEPRLDDAADARTAATVVDWLDTVIEPDAKRVRTKGDRILARLLLTGLHKTLFPQPPPFYRAKLP